MTTTNEPLENLGKQIDTMLKNSQHNATVVHNSKFLAVDDMYHLIDDHVLEIIKEPLINHLNQSQNY